MLAKIYAPQIRYRPLHIKWIVRIVIAIVEDIDLTGSSWDFEVKKGGRVQSISCGIREMMNILLHGIESERDL